MKFDSYTITDSTDLLSDEHNVTPYLKSQIEQLYHQVIKGKLSVIPRLRKLIKQNPKTPTLKNYLVMVYQQQGQIKKAFEINRKILADHPDYLFAKITFAQQCLSEKRHEEVPKILGEQLDIQALYPNRNVFHFSEVIAFNQIKALYFIAIDSVEQAEQCVDTIKKIDPYGDQHEEISMQIIMHNVQKGHERYLREQEKQINVTVKPPKITRQVKHPPIFKNDIINKLYMHSFEIGHDVLRSILSLPEQELIHDLELVIDDSIISFEKYVNGSDRIDFILHAIFLLGELKSPRAINLILKVLRRDGEYLNFYIGDYLTEIVWMIFYNSPDEHLPLLLKFMKEPGVGTFSKSEVSSGVAQKALHHPEKRNLIIEWYKEVLGFFARAKLNDNVIDSLLLGLICSDLLDLRAEELLTQVEGLYKKDLVSASVCGTLEDFKAELETPERLERRKESKDLYDLYNALHEKQIQFEQGSNEIDWNNAPIITENNNLLISEKVGRNQPCPCGSGLKYKKCCL